MRKLLLVVITLILATSCSPSETVEYHGDYEWRCEGDRCRVSKDIGDGVSETCLVVAPSQVRDERFNCDSISQGRQN